MKTFWHLATAALLAVVIPLEGFAQREFKGRLQTAQNAPAGASGGASASSGKFAAPQSGPTSSLSRNRGAVAGDLSVDAAKRLPAESNLRQVGQPNQQMPRR